MEIGPRLAVPVPVPEERAAGYRAAGLWDSRTLADGIASAAATMPDRVAVTDGWQRLTWAQLESAVGLGVEVLAGAGSLVLVVGNTVEAVVAVHAALRAGVPAVLLDRRCGPADVTAAMAVLPGRPILAAPEAELARLGIEAPETRALERFALGPGDPGPTADHPEPDRDAVALVLLTSGTTGRPKAVVHSINTLTAGAANMARITGCGADDVLFLVSPLASITGVMHLLVAADQHAGLGLEDAFEPEATLARMDAAGATILGGAPVIAERLLDAARRRGQGVPLRTLALGGAMLPRPLLEEATAVFAIEIARVYGSSEAPNHTGSVPGDDPERRLADDGVLQPGSEVRVGSSAHPEEGLLRGPAVFLGYVDAEDNAVAFEDGWYRTGDLVELHGGRLTVTGRITEVVNRNGLKISPSEIDQTLAGIAGVAEHASFGVPDPDTGERLAVAVRLEEGAHLTLDDLVAHLLAAGVGRRKLPEQLVVWEGPLPRTASGKVVPARLRMDVTRHRSEVVARLHAELERSFESDVESG